ncbi:MAG: SEC-C domain-containing protein [Peptostreptococcaceae bacterium]|nr:SEC-C domain-containing protein [Peptostreptococcaceae bacterium]
MGLFDDWNRMSEDKQNQEEYDEFWKAYFLKEKDAYDKILTGGKFVISGKTSDVAKELGLSSEELTGFIDGINTSLKKPIEVEKLEADSEISMDIEVEKLYLNMHKAEADWLYDLEIWNNLLSAEKREEIKKDFNSSKTFKREEEKVGRNDPCPCGSGKKYKKCCGKNK